MPKLCYLLTYTVWTVNDVLVVPYPFLFWLIHTLFIELKGYGSTKTKKGLDQPKQKKVWIKQDVIDGPCCILSARFQLEKLKCPSSARNFGSAWEISARTHHFPCSDWFCNKTGSIKIPSIFSNLPPSLNHVHNTSRYNLRSYQRRYPFRQLCLRYTIRLCST